MLTVFLFLFIFFLIGFIFLLFDLWILSIFNIVQIPKGTYDYLKFKLRLGLNSMISFTEKQTNMDFQVPNLEQNFTDQTKKYLIYKVSKRDILEKPVDPSRIESWDFEFDAYMPSPRINSWTQSTLTI